jgi:hypothetical protein
MRSRLSIVAWDDAHETFGARDWFRMPDPAKIRGEETHMKILLIAILLISGVVSAQTPPNKSSGALDLARPQDYSAYRSTSGNPAEFSNMDDKQIMPGETLVIADLQGPGMVAHIWITVAENEFAWPRLLRVRAYYDGAKTPSVDVPLGDFFGVGHGYERNVDSMMVRDSSFGRARNCYWPMPFRKSCRITVTNEGKRISPMFFYHVDWRKYDTLPADIRYFHAHYRQERPAASGLLYEFLNIRGTGHYVGTVFNILQSQVGWFGEGDDEFYVDGAPHAVISGTGSEDYFNDAWDLRVANGPWTGIPVAEGVRLGARLTGYRWHVPDPVPFKKSISAGIEHKGWTYNPDGTVRPVIEERPDFFSSVAFWYQEGVNEGLPEPPYGDARLPLGNAEQIPAVNAINDVTTEKGKAKVMREVDWSKDLLLFEAEGVGAKINVPVDIGADGRYEIVALLAQAPDYGNYVALLDGKPTNEDKRELATSEVPPPGPEIYHNYLPEVYVAVDRPLGWYQLTKGRHTLTFVCVGKDGPSYGYNLGINDLVIEKIPAIPNLPQPSRESAPPLPEIAPAVPPGTPIYRGLPLSAYLEKLKSAPEAERPDVLRAIGSFGADAAPAVNEVAAALASPSVDTRRAAGWALSQIGPSGATAAPVLARTLFDSDPQVRLLAAIALKEMGPNAAPALPDLVRALNDPSEFVRTRSADALGAMGPAAHAAVRPLADKLLAKGETWIVLTSVATALGNIGPDAKDALPILKQTFNGRRVGMCAREAILKIEGQPVPQW